MFDAQDVPSPVVPPSGATDKRMSLSPSRASDFQTCPLLYRLRHVDRLPEPPGVESHRGTLVHAVLERLFDLPASGRTLDAALDLLQPQWVGMVADADPDLVDLLFGPPENFVRKQSGEPLLPADDNAIESFLAEAEKRLRTYFTLEDPSRLEPAERELEVAAIVAGGLQLRGFVDRLDRAPDGRTRVVDYKSGKAPREMFEQKAMFQLRCYGLALWRAQGVAPTVLQLLYLGDGKVLRYEPDEADLFATERKLAALWQAILRAYDNDDWRPRPSAMCGYCSFKSSCPEWGGSLSVAEPAVATTVEG
jgi:putative RecB family exonuclease